MPMPRESTAKLRISSPLLQWPVGVENSFYVRPTGKRAANCLSSSKDVVEAFHRATVVRAEDAMLPHRAGATTIAAGGNKHSQSQHLGRRRSLGSRHSPRAHIPGMGMRKRVLAGR